VKATSAVRAFGMRAAELAALFFSYYGTFFDPTAVAHFLQGASNEYSQLIISPLIS
jgi:hypothetical protein